MFSIAFNAARKEYEDNENHVKELERHVADLFKQVEEAKNEKQEAEEWSGLYKIQKENLEEQVDELNDRVLWLHKEAQASREDLKRCEERGSELVKELREA